MPHSYHRATSQYLDFNVCCFKETHGLQRVQVHGHLAVFLSLLYNIDGYKNALAETIYIMWTETQEKEAMFKFLTRLGCN